MFGFWFKWKQENLLLKFTDLYNYCAANGKKDRGESRQPTTKVHALYGSESEGGKRISKCGCQRLFIRRYISSCKKHLIYFEWPHNISREKNAQRDAIMTEGGGTGWVRWAFFYLFNSGKPLHLVKYGEYYNRYKILRTWFVQH